MDNHKGLTLDDTRYVIAGLHEWYEKMILDCRNNGTHDISGGELRFVEGHHYSFVGIEVSGKCPNCNGWFKRSPTAEEMSTEKYREMEGNLTTREEIFRQLNSPKMSSA